MKKTRNDLWSQYQREKDLLERFGQKNIITFDQWLDIKGYCKKIKQGQEYEIH